MVLNQLNRKNQEEMQVKNEHTEFKKRGDYLAKKENTWIQYEQFWKKKKKKSFFQSIDCGF